MSEVIFSTIHGSRLYGFATEDSDYDVFTVVDSRSRRVRHRVQGNQDQCTVGIDRFLELLRGGSHQSVEALFSREKEWGAAAEHWRPLLEQTRVTGPEVMLRYSRTIINFAYGDRKRRRHAIRLRFNQMDLRAAGRCNPRLSEDDIERANEWSALEGDDLLWRIGM